MGESVQQFAYLDSSFSTRLRFRAVPFLVTPAPVFFGPSAFGPFLRGVFGAEEFFPLDTLNLACEPFSLASARIFTRRSEIARGVGASWPSNLAEVIV